MPQHELKIKVSLVRRRGLDLLLRLIPAGLEHYRLCRRAGGGRIQSARLAFRLATCSWQMGSKSTVDFTTRWLKKKLRRLARG